MIGPRSSNALFRFCARDLRGGGGGRGRELCVYTSSLLINYAARKRGNFHGLLYLATLKNLNDEKLTLIFVTLFYATRGQIQSPIIELEASPFDYAMLESARDEPEWWLDACLQRNSKGSSGRGA